MNLLIRADASTQIGTGHVMRCIALAQAWQAAGGSVCLAAAHLPDALAERLAAEQVAVQRLDAQAGSPADAEATIAAAQAFQADWMVVDGYTFDSVYQRRLKDAGLRLLWIDDEGHAAPYCADLVLNANISATAALYERRSATTHLLPGPRYALLRREFVRQRSDERRIPAVARRILVTMGGSDPQNVTLKILAALRLVDLPDLEAIAVIGGGNPHGAQLAAAIGDLPWIRLERNVHDMPALMAWADLAISAGGGTCLELACMGVPTLALIVADNQRPGAAAMHAAGMLMLLGDADACSAAMLAQAVQHSAEDPDARTALMRRGREMIDGRGSERVAHTMLRRMLVLRPAGAADCELLWEWANNPGVRSVSFVSDPIPWEAHVAWFAARLDDPACTIYVAEIAGRPIGQIRFDQDGARAVVSVSMDQAWRSHGYGSEIIRLGAIRRFEAGDIQQLDAYIKPDNAASIRAFERAGFRFAERTAIRNQPAERLMCTREML